jgi:hypothetical protein
VIGSAVATWLWWWGLTAAGIGLLGAVLMPLATHLIPIDHPRMPRRVATQLLVALSCVWGALVGIRTALPPTILSVGEGLATGQGVTIHPWRYRSQLPWRTALPAVLPDAEEGWLPVIRTGMKVAFGGWWDAFRVARPLVREMRSSGWSSATWYGARNTIAAEADESNLGALLSGAIVIGGTATLVLCLSALFALEGTPSQRRFSRRRTVAPPGAGGRRSTHKAPPDDR